MPVATAVVSAETESGPAHTSLKAGASPSPDAVAATLRSLYPRAAAAFLNRDAALTHSLLASAFAILAPPVTPADDALAPHRRKWDILRVTFETTAYADPPSAEDPEAFPPALRANKMLSPCSLVSQLHARSIQLFTPAQQQPDSAFLPTQILVTLALASMRLQCPEVGRSMVEDWLARRAPSVDREGLEGYANVLELYCLQVLPRLQEWDYAADFIQYETELPQAFRDDMLTSLRKLHQETIEARQTPPSLTTTNGNSSSPASSSSSTSRSASSSRPPSPSPSVSSESSNSTHTATPRSPRLSVGQSKYKHKNITNHGERGREREKGRLYPLTGFTPSSSSSSSSLESATTSRTVTPDSVRRGGQEERGRGRRDTTLSHVKAKSKEKEDSGHTVLESSVLPRPPRSKELLPLRHPTSHSTSHSNSHLTSPTSHHDSHNSDPNGRSITVSAPSMFTLLRSYISTFLSQFKPYLTSTSLTERERERKMRMRMLTIVFLVVVIPLVSFVLRLRMRMRMRMQRRSGSSSLALLGTGTGGNSGNTASRGGGTVQDVRRRLALSTSEGMGIGMGVLGMNALRKWWLEFVRAVVDMVRMGGRGLV